jgi:D-beta-D-heptose 7-phosphate kinase/D-beta-D-heptose 1-phosphate adenosyltransferase
MTELATTQPQKLLKILLIGDDCVDVYQFGTVDRISPEAPVPVFKLSHSEERGGMARNVKLNLEKLGCKVDYLSGKTSTKTRLIDSRSKQHIVRIDNDVVSDPITFETIIPPGYDAIVISDYEKGTISYGMVQDLIKEFKGPVFIDTKKKDLAKFQGAFVKINELEHSKLISECNNLIVTLGDKGSRYHSKIYPAVSVDVSDVCGAGDTFLSALTVQYLLTNDIIEAILFANVAAGISVQHLGNYSPTYQEIVDA